METGGPPAPGGSPFSLAAIFFPQRRLSPKFMTTQSASQGFLCALAAAALLAAFAAGAVAQAPAPVLTPDPVAAEAASRQDRIEELEFLVTQTTAENERLQMELRAARQDVARLQRLVAEMAEANQALEQSVSAPRSEDLPATAAGAQRSQDDRIAEARNAATGVLGVIPADASLPAASALDPEAAAAAFRHARELLLAAPLPDAEAAFADYLQRFPSAEDAPDARYWLAFTMLGQGDYQNAATAFADYLQMHKDDPGPRNQAAAALLRLGISLAGMGMRADACLAFRDSAAHPRASQTTRSQAAQEQRRNGCGAG